MKYDKKGIPCGLEETEHLPEFIEKDDSLEYFNRLKKELPWQEVTWQNTSTFPKLVFRYGEFERNFREYKILEELIRYIEEVLETDVTCIWCDYYRSGKDYTPAQQYTYDSNVFSLTFGQSRKIKIEKIRGRRNRNNSCKYTLDSGDGFYLSKDNNKKYKYSIPRIRSRKDSINIIFYIDEPYSHRKHHLRYINLLGYGKVPIYFEGPESEFPEDSVATIIPLNMMNSYTGGFMSRPEFDVILPEEDYYE